MDINFRLSQIILEVLIGNGCRRFVFCPGARNSPLIRTLFFLRRSDPLYIESHYDERGAAFFALGLAKRTHRPSVVITTSGTAVANLYPAMVEAFHSDVPLIALTADRPHHLQNISANQTIDQKQFFGAFTRAGLMIGDFQELSPRDENILIEDVKKTMLPLAQGPIHINCPFDEPLLSAEMNEGMSRSSSSAFPLVKRGVRPSLDRSGLEDRLHGYLKDFMKTLEITVRGLVIVGDLNQAYKKEDIFDLLRIFMDRGWYVIAEAHSGMRYDLYRYFHNYGWGSGRDFLLENYSLLLEKSAFAKAFNIDTVFHIGGRLLSKSLSRFLKENMGVNYIHINRNSHPYDPEGVVTRHYQIDPPLFCRAVVDSLYDNTRRNQPHWETGRFLSVSKRDYRFRKIDLELTKAVQGYVFQGFNELEISRVLAQFSREGLGEGEHPLFIGNSMPIRDFNTLATRVGFTQVFSNRGVSGIDGLIATVAGIASGRRSTLESRKRRGRLYALLGDLSTLHDSNSLVLCRRAEEGNSPVTLLVINNHEGTIFRYLPVAEVIDKYPERDKDKFYYRHHFSFAHFAASVGLKYHKISQSMSLKRTLEELHRTPYSYLIELEVNPTLNWQEHIRFHIDMMNRVDSLLSQY